MDQRWAAATPALIFSEWLHPCSPLALLPLPKAELHLHLKVQSSPRTVCALTAQHGVVMTKEEVRQRYAYRDCPGFIEAFKWR